MTNVNIFDNQKCGFYEQKERMGQMPEINLLNV